jgi:hypothetical protein
MAMMKLETLVLRVVPVVVRDVVAGLKTIGSRQANGQAPTVTLSFARHLLPGNPGTDPNPTRYEPAIYGEAHAAQRAGRSGSPAGVPDSTTAAITAGSAILSGWSVAMRGTRRVARSWRDLQGTTTVATDRSLSGHSQSRMHPPAFIRAVCGTGLLSWKCLRDELDAKMPAYGMLKASLGGR